MITVRRALISVYDKTGIVAFAGSLAEQGVELLSTGATARALADGGLAVTPLEQLTGFGDLFGGRVKTLTPQVHGGLLLRRDHEEDLQEARAHEIEPLDLLCVNLYPFSETVTRPGATREECIEMIDIGGPAMIRAAAKNHRGVIVVTSPDQYAGVAEQISAFGGRFSSDEAARLATDAFALTASYDAAVHQYLTGDAGKTESEAMPYRWATGGTSLSPLRYGENPNQRGACYAAPHGFWRDVQQHQGKKISFNNLADLWAGWEALQEFAECAGVVIKHRTPCGIAIGGTPAVAFERARDCDALSAFGGVVLINRPGDGDVAVQLADMFLEVVAAPGWSEEALEILRRKRNLRVFTLPDAHDAGRGNPFTSCSIGEAALVQDVLPAPKPCDQWKCVTKREADDVMLQELFFAWRVVRHVRSNAIALTRGQQALGLGSGQTSRIDACEVAMMKAGRTGHVLQDSVLASDAFFPFRDVVDRAATVGIAAIVQPGGSRRDQESIDACNEKEIAMYFTEERAFVH